jgi:hypothetical protein
MRQSFFLLLALSVLTSQSASGQKVVPNKSASVELTETDIARLEDFDGKTATVFGIGLNMTMSEVTKIVQKQKNLRLQIDKINLSRMYLYSNPGKNDTGGPVLLGYLKWKPNDSALNQIVLYQEITPYLKGLSCSILSNSCLNPESEVYKNFLGAPADQDVVVDAPSVGLKTIRYYYPALSLMIEEQKNGDEVKYSLILYGFKG